MIHRFCLCNLDDSCFYKNDKETEISIKHQNGINQITRELKQVEQMKSKKPLLPTISEESEYIDKNEHEINFSGELYNKIQLQKEKAITEIQASWKGKLVRKVEKNLKKTNKKDPFKLLLEALQKAEEDLNQCIEIESPKMCDLHKDVEREM